MSGILDGASVVPMEAWLRGYDCRANMNHVLTLLATLQAGKMTITGESKMFHRHHQGFC